MAKQNSKEPRFQVNSAIPQRGEGRWYWVEERLTGKRMTFETRSKHAAEKQLVHLMERHANKRV